MAVFWRRVDKDRSPAPDLYLVEIWIKDWTYPGTSARRGSVVVHGHSGRAPFFQWGVAGRRLVLTRANTLGYDAAPIPRIAMAIRFQTIEHDMVAAYRLHYAMNRKEAVALAG